MFIQEDANSDKAELAIANKATFWCDIHEVVIVHVCTLSSYIADQCGKPYRVLIEHQWRFPRQLQCSFLLLQHLQISPTFRGRMGCIALSFSKVNNVAKPWTSPGSFRDKGLACYFQFCQTDKWPVAIYRKYGYLTILSVILSLRPNTSPKFDRTPDSQYNLTTMSSRCQCVLTSNLIEHIALST